MGWEGWLKDDEEKMQEERYRKREGQDRDSLETKHTNGIVH